MDMETQFSARSTSATRTQARNRVLARLLCCLVNERLFEAYLVQDKDLLSTGLAKHWICLCKNINSIEQEGSLWAPLKGLPAFELGGEGVRASKLPRVGLLDTDDIGFPVKRLSCSSQLVDVVNASQVIELLNKWHPNLDSSMTKRFALEVESSVVFLEAAYRHRPPLPSLGTSTAIDWEQSIVEGHPTHPANKARFAVSPTLPLDPEDENALLQPELLFFSVPRDKATVRGEYESILSPLLPDTGTGFDPDHEIVVPVHPVQVPNVSTKFPLARQLHFTRPALAQTSLRTVVPVGLQQVNLKLAMGVVTSSAMRTISPWSTHIGPTFQAVANRIVQDKELLVVCNELASVVSNHPDPDIAKHLSCVIREDPQYLAGARGEQAVICAALTELDQDGQYVINKVLGLDTSAAKEAFFQHYVRLFLKAFLPPITDYGLTFEAHLQNVLARFKLQETTQKWHLVGFMVRDFGGIKVHQQTLFQSTGLQVDVWNEEACVLAHNLEDVHHVAYHTMIQCHIHRFARALGVHYKAKGWAFVREELDKLLPAKCMTRSLWLDSPTADWKAFINMKLQGLYRDYLYTKVPNLITYVPPRDLKVNGCSHA